MADFIIKKGATSPALPWTVVDQDGAVVDLTGATACTFVMRTQTGIAPSTNLSAAFTDRTNGLVTYTWTATDTATAGTYMGEFHITQSDGTLIVAPPFGYIEVSVEEDLVTPGGARIVNLGEVKDYLRIPASDRSHDGALTRMIDAYTPVVENITGPVLQRLYQDERYDGTGTYIILRHHHVLEVQSVTETRGPIDYPLTQVASPSLGTIYSYMFHEPNRIVRRTVGGGVTEFPRGLDSVTVTYLAGYTTVPLNIREGMKELIRVNYQQTQQQRGPGQRPNPQDDVPTGMPAPPLIPQPVRELLSPTRRAPRVA